MGRAVLDWHPDGRPLSIRLQSTPRVRGRVMTGGVPVPGVSVRAVPDRQTFETAVDAVAIVAPAQVTAPGGQFDLAVPGEGGGQVVIGGPELGTVRIAYPDASRLEGMVELGDIELPSLVDLGVRFRPGCDVLSVGPIGELGVVVVRSVFEPTTGLYQLEVPEPGWWWLEAMCPESSAAVASRLVLVNHRSSLQPVDLSADLGQPR